MHVTVVVPWRAGCPHRARAWSWVRRRYALTQPGWRVVEAAAAPGEWCKAIAVMPAIAALPDSEIVVVADADVWCADLEQAIDIVAAGGARWAIPHLMVRRLTPDATAALLEGRHADELCERPYRGVAGGGIVIGSREALLDTPLDPRFVGWGQEDVSWSTALTCLQGQAWRGRADLLHLWHPPQPRQSRKIGSTAGHQLHRRYLACRRDPRAMRALIQEVPVVPRDPAQHARHDHAPLALRCQ